VIGLDLGERRIGVAVSDSNQRLATGVTTVARSGDRPTDHRRLATVVDDYEAAGVVVGLPLSLSGATGPAAARVLAEIPDLAAAVGVPVALIDERLTTVAATTALRAAGRSSRQQRHVVDQTAAGVLLQSWLDRRARTEQERTE
jgi:putative holliday junction resolvase